VFYDSTIKGSTVKIGIIGQGFVGSAIREGLKSFYPCYTYDIDLSKASHTHEQVVNNSDIIFICVPTPMRKSGECDTRILKKAVSDVELAVLDNKDPILVLKSTIPPGTTEKISKLTRLNVCFSPEFLTEANSFDDFKNQSRIIVGGPRPATGKVKQMFRKAFPTVPIVKTGTKTAEMVKYFTNCFLASKVTFANEMYEICSKHDIDFDKVTEYALHDSRIGKTHLMVPGPDGDRGFGGHCFPKDLAAMVYFAKKCDVYPNFLLAVQESNEIYRSDKDWEKMKGRAVSED
jgi:nucleotide sugar dehydrogenase